MKISILGCGVYGLALASSFMENNNNVTMWSKFDEEVSLLTQKYLNISFTTDLELASKDVDLIVIAIPVAFLEDTIISLKDIYNGQDILIASKGIDIKEQKFAYEIINKYLTNASIGVISGGTFANDMSNKKVMGLTLATNSINICNKVKNGLESNFLKIQYINDIIGVSICGAIKNVMAIGFGILDGAKFPPSSKFLFLTEAIYEIINLIEALGGNKNTILSYAGIDDIMMTCTSDSSRNYTLGKMIGENTSIEEIDNYKKNTTIEGLGTSEAIYKLAKNNNISLPISFVIYKILYENENVSKLINLLEKRKI